MHTVIYKIENADTWANATIAGTYLGSPLDLKDGFIHLSTAEQVRETAGKWFAGRTGLVLIGVATASLGDSLQYEPSRDGALFPHLYGPLIMSVVVSVTEMPLSCDGLHVFGPEIV